MTTRSRRDEETRRRLRRTWALVIAAWVAILALLAVTAARGERLSLLVVPAVLLVLGAIRLVLRHRLAAALRASGPEPLMALSGRIGAVPEAAHFAAAARANAAALWGQPDVAERELRSVDWRATSSLLQPAHAHAEAVISFARGEWAAGLRQAEAVLAQPILDGVPFAARSRRALELDACIGRAFTGAPGASDRTTLEAAFGSTNMIERLLAAWGLVALAHVDGRDASAELAFIARHAPHCVLFRQLPAARP